MANHSSWTVGQQKPTNKHMHLISGHVDFSRGYILVGGLVNVQWEVIILSFSLHAPAKKTKAFLLFHCCVIKFEDFKISGWNMNIFANKQPELTLAKQVKFIFGR